MARSSLRARHSALRGELFVQTAGAKLVHVPFFARSNLGPAGFGRSMCCSRRYRHRSDRLLQIRRAESCRKAAQEHGSRGAPRWTYVAAPAWSSRTLAAMTSAHCFVGLAWPASEAGRPDLMDITTRVHDRPFLSPSRRKIPTPCAAHYLLPTVVEFGQTDAEAIANVFE